MHSLGHATVPTLPENHLRGLGRWQRLPPRTDPQDLLQGSGETPWLDDLQGGSWSCPVADDDDESSRTIAEIDTLLGELIAELEA